MHFAVQYVALMGIDAATLAAEIGARVKAARSELGWTLDQLAEHAAISRRMVVNVEQGAANPSLGTLLHLSEALGIGVSELVEPPATDRFTITRAGNGATLWHGDRGGDGVLITSARTPDSFELWSWRLAAGETHASDAHPTGTHELLQVTEGTLAVTVGEERVELGVGDALALPGDVAHSYANETSGSTRFTMAVYEPVSAPKRRELPSDG